MKSEKKTRESNESNGKEHLCFHCFLCFGPCISLTGRFLPLGNQPSHQLFAVARDAQRGRARCSARRPCEGRHGRLDSKPCIPFLQQTQSPGINPECGLFLVPRKHQSRERLQAGSGLAQLQSQTVNGSGCCERGLKTSAEIFAAEDVCCRETHTCPPIVRC